VRGTEAAVAVEEEVGREEGEEEALCRFSELSNLRMSFSLRLETVVAWNCSLLLARSMANARWSKPMAKAEAMAEAVREGASLL
jgi:hypothetical protein